MGLFHFGYLDPGTGSILIQGLIGGFLGASYIGRKFIGRMMLSAKNIFSGKKADSKNFEVSDKS